LAAVRTDGLADDASARIAAVVASHERTLLRIARQSSLCHDDALDAYQRALEIFVRRVDTVDPATEVAWLKVVVRHEAMAIRRARSETVAGEEIDIDAVVPGADRSVEEKVASGERVRRSAEALRALKPDEAKALMMKAHGLSYEEIGKRNGWTYTKVNRAITEGRRRFMSAYEGIESGEECERVAPIIEALAAGSATAAQVIAIRPHLRHCTTCRATVRDLRLSRVRRASLFWPIFAVLEPLGRLPSSEGRLEELAGPTVEDRLRELAEQSGVALAPADPAGVVPAVDGIGVSLAPAGPDEVVPVVDGIVPAPEATDTGLQLGLELLVRPEEVERAGRITTLKHDVTALFHRAQASDLATGAGIATSGGGGRIATIGTVLGLCLSGASVGTVCVVTGVVSVSGVAQQLGWSETDGRDQPARDASQARKAKPHTTVKRVAPVSVASRDTSRAARVVPTATPTPARQQQRSRKAAAKEAAPREFGFEQTSPGASTAASAPATAQSAQASPSAAAPSDSASKGFDPAEQEFAP
jgi:RNA polymerase sigma factor (sigma-70 family)